MKYKDEKQTMIIELKATDWETGTPKKKPIVNSDDLEGKEVSFWSSKTRKQQYFELYVKQNNACVY
jgi:hypothetical protein